MTNHEPSDPQFDAMTARMLHREAQRRAAQEINTTSGPGLENALAQISAEVTAEAVALRGPLAGNVPAAAVMAPTPSSNLPSPPKK